MQDKPLHILITDPHLQGGGQVRYLSTLAQGLVRLNCRVTIGCRPKSVLVNHAAEAGAEGYSRFAFPGGLRLCRWRRDIATAMRYIREQRPDILHVNGSEDHWTMAIANTLLGHPVPLLRTRHNTYVVKNNWPNRVLNRNITDYQIVVCETVRQSLARHPAFDANRLCSIHNGVDAIAYQADPEKRRQAREEFSCKDTDVVCGIVARLVPAKGHEYLFRAAARLKDSCPSLRILVFGQGVLEKQLRLLASELGIAPMVRFLGFRNDVAFCIQAFDIGVQPSIDCDTSSFSMKEQMAAGIPLIASDYGGLGEIIADGVEGFLVPAGTVEPLADALRKLVEDQPLRTCMGAAGRLRVQAEFSSEVFVSRTLDVYRSVIAAHQQQKGLS